MDTAKKPHKKSIALINDKSLVVDLICNDLATSGIEISFRSDSIKDALSQLSVLKKLPKTCIIDLNFYDRNVLKELQELRTRYPDIKLIAHSDIDTEETAKELRELGVESYLLIGSNADDFKKVIDRI